MLHPSYIVNRMPGPVAAAQSPEAAIAVRQDLNAGKLNNALRPGGQIIAADACRQPC